MRAILIDDDKAMLIILQRLLNRIEGVTVTGSFQHAADAVEWLRAEEADLAFIDIQMAGERDGIELARQLSEHQPYLKLVFVTSHMEYSLDAFDLGAFDYLVKPVRFERVEQTIRRIVRERTMLASSSSRSNRLTVRGLGGLQVSSSKGEVKWMSAKSAELFAYLLMHRDQGAAIDRILEDLFDGMPSRQANTYLNNAVYQLRQTLKQHGFDPAVVSLNRRYKLLPDVVDADFISFENRMATFGEIAEWNVEQACETDRLYRGDLFEETGYLWSMAEKERLSAMYRRFSYRLGDWLLAEGQMELAFPIVNKLAARHETDETANALLLRFYAAARDRNAVVAHYNKYAKLVLEELGLSPGNEITRLFDQLIAELDSKTTE